AQDVLASQLSARGAAAYTRLASGEPAAAARTARAKSAAAKGTQNAAAAAAVKFPMLDAATMAAEVFEQPLVPAVRIEDKEISFLDSAFGPWIGISVLSSLRAEVPATVIISGNRVTTPDSTITACGLAFPHAAVISGNILMQQGLNQDAKNFASLIVI